MMAYDYVITKPPLNEETLMHYGVKGMRWGRRKQQLISQGYSRRQARRQVHLEKGLVDATNRISSYADKKINKYKRKMEGAGDTNKRKKYENLMKAYQISKDKNLGVEKRYTNAKIKAVRDSNYKKSKEYKSAIKTASKNARGNRIGGGLTGPKLTAVEDIMLNNRKAMAKRSVRKVARNMNYHLKRGHKIAGYNN